VLRKFLILLAAMALVPFGLAACGDDDDEDSGSATTAAEETTTAPDDTGGGGGGSSTVTITADPSGALAFEEDTAEATAGSVTVELVNDSSTPHNVEIEGDSGDLGGTDTISGDTATTTIDLEAGEYTFYCSVPGHEEAGMKGTLTVN
jgi:plastocyanin